MWNTGTHKLAVMLLGVSGLLTSAVSAEVTYQAADLRYAPQANFDIALGRPAVTLNRPTFSAINDLGQLVGQGHVGGSTAPWGTRPFFYDPQQHTAANLGDLTYDFADPDMPSRNELSTAHAINNAGWVVGTSSMSSSIGVANDRPFLWIDADGNHAHTLGEMHEIPLNPGASFGSALRINNQNQALVLGDTGLYLASLGVSQGNLAEAAPRVFITSHADVVDLNDSGQVVFSANGSGYVWRDMNLNSSADPSEIVQIPSMSVSETIVTVYAINNNGLVIGTMRNDARKEVGFIWTDLDKDHTPDFTDANANGIFEWNEASDEILRFHVSGDLNSSTEDTFFFDLNDSGQVVGAVYDGSIRRAFVFDGLQLRYLDELVDPAFPLELRQANAISNTGWIAAVGRANGGSTDHIVLLAPIPPSLPGDLNGDGFVGIDDLNIVLGRWNQAVPPPSTPDQGDPSGDGFVGIEDLNLVLSNWNVGSPAMAEPIRSIPAPNTMLTMVLLGGIRVMSRTVRGHHDCLDAARIFMTS